MGAAAAVQSRRAAAAADVSGRKVLVVDDDRGSVQRIIEALSPHGYQFLTAHDGAEALGVLKAAKPDLLVMDVEMPRLGGVEVCRIVKANSGEGGFGFIPVILMTAGQAAGGKVEGLELGADDYLVKPFDMLELGARVKSMLRLKALTEALLEKNRELEWMNRELERRRSELLELTRTDALTGLFNRRYFEERLALEYSRALRYGSQLSLVMVDIDHFKRLNDTWGHPFGDLVLKRVARVAKESLRDVDMLARYGGEELVVLLPETGAADALRVCERVRSAIETLELRAPEPGGDPAAADGPRVSVTASLGVASFPQHGLTGPDSLVRAADDCLYEAKAGGRNRVHQRPDPAPDA